MTGNYGPNTGETSNPNTNAWDSLSNESRPRGKFVEGPDGKLIPEEEYDAAMEAYERKKFYEKNPGAKEHEALLERLGQMESDPDRLNRFEGEHIRGASTRDSEYTTLNGGENGMYVGSINNAKRQEMARKMHDAEDLQTFEEDARYAAYIARERAKIGTVYKTRDEFNHKVVSRLKRLRQNRPGEPTSEPAGPDQQGQDPIINIEPMGDPNDKGNNPTQEDPNKNTSKDPNKDSNKDLDGDPDKDSNRIDIDKTKINKINEQLDQIETEKLEKLENDLAGLLPKLAELYAKNRRLIIGRENKQEFAKIQGQYSELLDEYLGLKAKQNHARLTGEAIDKINSRIEAEIDEIKTELTEFVGGDLEHPEKTQEEIDTETQRLIDEANKILVAEYGELMDKVKAEVNADFINDLLEAQIKMENATIDALDNGSFCRKLVHHVINNKYLKGALLAAGIAGLAVTGIGLATGATAIGIGYTVSGVAMGAAKGAAAGFIMSRQDSRQSNIRGFAEKGKDHFEDIEFLRENGEDYNTRRAADWIMTEYVKANRADRGVKNEDNNDEDENTKKKRKKFGNIQKTVIAMGLGGLFGGGGSGIHFYNTYQTPTTTREVVGYTPDQYDVDISKVNIPKGKGMYETFAQLGGDPSQQEMAVDLAWTLDSKYGLSPGSNGVNVGFDGTVGVAAHTYEGPINTWPDISQAYIKDVIQLWAKNGLIPAVRTAGQPIYNAVTNFVTNTIPDQFHNLIARGLGAIIPAGIGGIIGGVKEGARSRLSKTPENTGNNPEGTTPSAPEPESAPESVSAPESEPVPDDSVETDNQAERALEEAENSYSNALRDTQDYLGGPDNLKYFFDNGFTDEEYYDYWQSLDDVGRDYARVFLESVPAEQRDKWNLGRDFMNWLTYYDEVMNEAMAA